MILNDELAPFRKEQLIYVSLEIYEDGESVTLPVFSHPVSGPFSDWLRAPSGRHQFENESKLNLEIFQILEIHSIGINGSNCQ